MVKLGIQVYPKFRVGLSGFFYISGFKELNPNPYPKFWVPVISGTGSSNSKVPDFTNHAPNNTHKIPVPNTHT
jgi:hypothetical protein